VGNGIKVVRGMRDILPEQTSWWQRLEQSLKDVLASFGYGEIRTPVLEPAELIKRSIGEETDIVEKETYTFEDRDGSLLTLRPEGTASIVRAYIDQNQWRKEPVTRWYYLGNMFRHERPQKGRYRQFSQIGAELIGSDQAQADVELINLMCECVSAVGLEGTSLEINSLGCPKCRPAYRDSLVKFLEGHEQSLCENCVRRLRTNPLRVLDCKVEGCQKIAEGAPHFVDALCEDCGAHFSTVRSGLDALAIPYKLNHRMVRGLDYYMRTTFELLAEGLGAQNAVAAGGRYDGLISSLGGAEVPAVGFAAGLDRMLIKIMETLAAPEVALGVFFVALNEACWQMALPAMQEIRRAGLRVMSDARGPTVSIKAQMKRADKLAARFVVIVGEDELAKGYLTVKDMAADKDAADKQFEVHQEKLLEAILERTG
jgi:histidyl-tRNA synthetase